MALFNGIAREYIEPELNLLGATGGTTDIHGIRLRPAGKPIVQGGSNGFGAYRSPSIAFQNNW